jgi:hypothetical protein
MNYLKLLLDLIAICGAAVIITFLILAAYSFAVHDGVRYDEFISNSAVTLMWASTVMGLLAGKYR